MSNAKNIEKMETKNTQTIENQLITLLNDVKNSGKIASFNFEINDVKREYHHDDDVCLEIGITFNSMNNWHWFNLESFVDGSEYLRFNHTYYRNTGKIRKSWKHGWNVRQSINRQLKTNLF
jgi:hypothetical protein